MDCSPDELVARRLAVQRLTTAPVIDPVEAVKLLLCVQAQDAPLARYSVGLRVADGTDLSVRAAVDDGRLVRTHLLRPTWQLVAADDLRWILALTSAKVVSSLAGRGRRLGVDGKLIDRVHDEFVNMLGRRRFRTAGEIGDGLMSVGLSLPTEAVRHLLLVAELRGLVCSGPLQGSTHTYGLVDELIDPAPPPDRDSAIREFVFRFFRGHGPASEQDLRHWTTLTLAEIRHALSELDEVLENESCGGTKLWFDASSVPLRSGRRRVAILPTFDEVYLPYRSVSPARISGHPQADGPHSFAEAGGGVVIVDNRDAGWWKRTVRPTGPMTVRLALATGLDAEQRELVAAEATNLAAFFGRTANIELVEP